MVVIKTRQLKVKYAGTCGLPNWRLDNCDNRSSFQLLGPAKEKEESQKVIRLEEFEETEQF